MSAPVKGSRRGDRSRATRARIVEAARALFLEGGYAATTLEGIAARAGVAVQTVYFHFGNKRTVLKHVLDLAAVGDDEQMALLERPWMQELRAAPDAAGAVAVWMRMSLEVYARVVPIMKVVHEASGSDPDLAEQERTSRAQTLTAHRALAAELAARGAVRPGLGVEDAAEELHALCSLELYLVATSELGWEPARWAAWVAALIGGCVLAPGQSRAVLGGAP